MKAEKEYGFRIFEEMFYGMSSDEKKKYLAPDYVQIFLRELNKQSSGLGDTLKKIYLTSDFPENWDEIRREIIGKEGIGVIMAEKPFGEGRPWGHEFMDVLYKCECDFPITPLFYFLQNCVSGEAVFQRKPAVVRNTMPILSSMIKCGNGDFRRATLVNLGSAFGYDVFELLESFPEIRPFMTAINIDIAKEAVVKGRFIADEKKTAGVSFHQGNMLKFNQYVKGADITWLIGMLCSFGHDGCVDMLKKSKAYLRSGGMCIGACVTDAMPGKDLFTCFVLQMILGWYLCYRRHDDVQRIFESSGYSYEGYFSEGHEELYCIGIGKAE